MHAQVVRKALHTLLHGLCCFSVPLTELFVIFSLLDLHRVCTHCGGIVVADEVHLIHECPALCISKSNIMRSCSLSYYRYKYYVYYYYISRFGHSCFVLGFMFGSDLH